MIARIVPAALLIAPLALVACEIQRAPANPPPAAAATEPAPPPVATPVIQTCPPVGYWKAGETEIKVSQSFAKPGSFDVSYKGVNLAQGAGTANGNQFTVDTGAASGGIYNCTLGADCKTMNCGFTGQQPTVFTKTGD